MAQQKHVVVDLEVFAQKVKIVVHVVEQATDHGGQVNHVRRLVALEHRTCRLEVTGKEAEN